MTDHEGWQVSSDAAEVYERCFVPALFGQWASHLVDAAQLTAGDRVLDVGCGTGVLAPAAADRLATDSQVTGLGLNDGMLTVARRLRPQIDWRQGDATQLPFADTSVDAALSQFALMYFPDRAAALREMVRVLRPGGPARRGGVGAVRPRHGLRHPDRDRAAPVWASRGRCPHRPVRLGERGHGRELFTAAGINEVDVELRNGTMTFPSIAAFVETEVKESPLEALLDEEGYEGLMREAQDKLQPFRVDSDVVMPIDAYIITAEKP
jgi:SAM-dependent methyltransferase